MKIIGRAAEMDALRATIDRIPGAPQNLVLHGDPGVGKTVLLQVAIDYAREQGIRVIGGTGYESEAQLAFAGLHQLFAPIMEYLDRVEPFQRSVLRRVLGFEDGTAPDRMAVSAASLAVLVAVAADGPVLVAVEDAHWIDVPTREVMMFILFRLRPEWDIRAIFARRSLTATERVSPGLNMTEVVPLDEEDAQALVRELYPGLPDVVRDRVLRDAAGNPLALAELPAVLGTAASTGLELLPDAAPLRTRLESGFAGRVLSLPPRTRSALLLTALDGDRLERGGTAVQSATLTPQELIEVEKLGLIARDSSNTTIRLRHPLVRSAIVGTASPGELRSAHATLAEAYRGQRERRLWHLAAATVEPDEAVAAEIEVTAKAIGTRGGAALAIMALQRAASLSPDQAEAARRLQDAAELAAECGQRGLATKLLDEAQQRLSDPAAAARASLTRAQLLLGQDGDLAAARKLLLRILRDGDSHGGCARAARMLILTSFYGGEADAWPETARSLEWHADCLGEDLRLLLSALGQTAAAGAPRAALLELLDEVSDDPPARELADLSLLAFRLDALPSARRHLRLLTSRESGSGAISHAVVGYLFTAHDQYLAGEWEQSEEVAMRGLELAIRHGLELAVNDFRCTLGRIAASRGDVETTRELSHTVEQWAVPRSSGLHLALSARNLTLAALSEGDYEAAFTHASRIAAAGSPGCAAGHGPWVTYDLVEAAVRTGRHREAGEHVAAVEEAAIADVTPRLRMQVLAARALTAPDEEAAPLLRATLALPGVEQWPFDAARLHLALGELHRRRLRPGDARPELRRAADIFARIGATAWQQRAEQELRATGVVVSGRGNKRVPAHQQSDLTSQQLEVAQLAATGLSNKEIGERLFLSSRTVSAHLYRIFPKLGITSRASLRDALEAAS